MIQEIIAYLIVAAAFGKCIHSIWSFFKAKNQVKPSACSGCSTGCETKELRLMPKRFPKNDLYKYYL